VLKADLLPFSAMRPVQESDLRGMDRDVLRIARNEIFARHGYAFKSADLRAYFSQYSWYTPKTKNVRLSAIEKLNVEFIKMYETSPNLRAKLLLQPELQTQATIVQQTVVVTGGQTGNLNELQKNYDELAGKIAALEAVLAMQNNKANEKNEQSQARSFAALQISLRLDDLNKGLRAQFNEAQSKYDTEILPSADFSKSSARELSRNFPKIPWYKPKYINELGEFWIEPSVNDQGFQTFALKFIEPNQTAQNVAANFVLTTEDARAIRDALHKAYDWSVKAKKNNVRDIFRKMIDCTPQEMCSEKVPGNTSTQLDFLVFEGGAVGARIIRNKGSFKEEFGISIESAALLSSYFDYVIAAGEAELEAGSRTKQDLDKLFE